MTDVKSLHRQAMDLADEGDRLRRSHAFDEATAVFLRAFEMEREAALMVDVEPSRGILHKSAAWLALEAGEARAAEAIAARGLAGLEVPADVAEELRAVLEDAQLRIHKPELPAPGATAAFEMTLKGGDIGYGDADPAEVIRRIELGQKLIHRTVERRNNKPFRKGGRVPADIINRTQPRLRVAPGSFTIRFELGGKQLSLWEEATGVVDDIIACFKAIATEEGGQEELERRIPNDSYRQNFAAIARSLAPDGKEVTQLAITGLTKEGSSRFILKGLPTQERPTGDGDSDGETVSVVGELLAADGTTRQSRIKLVPSEGGKALTIAVADALLEDIVRPYFGRRVRARLQKRTTKKGLVRYRLISLDEAPEDTSDA